MSKLAVVIPAYKAAFLSKTLQSLTDQTCKDFTIYIGNDAGDQGIEAIVKGFTDQLNIHYQYFTQNFGRSSLVKQWQRCLALTQGEEWLWLLPDDDYADPECVAFFYQYLQKSDFDLFRFNVHYVTADEQIFKTNPALPEVQPAFDSLMEKLSFYRPSSVAEFIFNRKKFEHTGFADIPMAWGTDDLLWYSMGKEKGILGCNAAHVYLRQSDLNISSNYGTIGNKKIDANFIFFNKLLQLEDFVSDLQSEDCSRKFIVTAQQHILYNLQDYSLRIGLSLMWNYAIKANRIWGGGVIRNLRRFWLNNRRIA
jgi:glycosyltransferase involved in cell wall biosynthesis